MASLKSSTGNFFGAPIAWRISAQNIDNLLYLVVLVHLSAELHDAQRPRKAAHHEAVSEARHKMLLQADSTQV